MRALILEGASPGLARAAERRPRVAQDELLARVLESEGIEPFVDQWMKLPLFSTQQRRGPKRLAQERGRPLRNAPGAPAAGERRGVAAVHVPNAAVSQGQVNGAISQACRVRMEGSVRVG